ncbi:MAG: hypothetical protein L6Q37_07380 [Bdellovibrionaceae bacterium]|nr:hypothetical protein [Pseudobdellovibrionaceae bacterium]NUM58833.1 hypothetical protein [Pseudobdellovibrionaceae bacterium]
MNSLIYIVRIFFIILYFSRPSFANVILLEKNSNVADFLNYLEKSDSISFSEFQLNEITKSSGVYNHLLQISESYLNVNNNSKELRDKITDIQKNHFFTTDEKKLMFHLFEKKISQELSQNENQQYVTLLCWIFSNDSQIQQENPHFLDYCRFNQITKKNLLNLSNNYRFLVTDGNLIDLKNDFTINYNEIPQKIRIISDKAVTIDFFGNVSELANNNQIKEVDFYIEGNCDDFKTNLADELKNYSVYFNDQCVKTIAKNNFWKRTKQTIYDNKYTILTSLILIFASYEYLKDKSISFDSISNLTKNYSLFSF